MRQRTEENTDENQSWEWKKQMNTQGELLKYAEQRLQTNGNAEIGCAVAWKQWQNIGIGLNLIRTSGKIMKQFGHLLKAKGKNAEIGWTWTKTNSKIMTTCSKPGVRC